MQEMQRRSFLSLALAALPVTVLGRSAMKDGTKSAKTGILVKSGEDRFAIARRTPTGSSAYKVATPDAGGGLFIMEHHNRKKGGPPLHLHHDVDEWFYVVQGEYLLQVGTERLRLHAGDSVLGPREVPHAWAFVGNTPGRMIIAFAPAGKMEAFFSERDRRGGTSYSSPAILRAHGMEPVGPPLPVD